MFQFTTTTVINSALEESGAPLWGVGTQTFKDGTTKTNLYIKRLGIFDKDNITAIYKSEGFNAVPEEWEFDFSEYTDVKDGDTFVLDLYIGLSEGSNYSLYANDFYYKGKPWFVNFVYKKSWEDTLKALVKMIKKYDVNVHYTKMFEPSSNGETLTIKAMNGYQRVKKATISKIDHKANNNLGDQYVVLEAENTVKGYEGFGTYEFIRNNLRLPTYEHTRAFSINDAENPIPGCLYDQYVIHMCVDRGTLGNNAVGDLVTSHTTHVIYINLNLNGVTPNGEFEEYEGSNISMSNPLSFESALTAIAPEKGIITMEFGPESDKKEEEDDDDDDTLSSL